MSACAIMVLGTGSHVGKSLTVAALCRILARSGHRVAPFKAQNMSLNSAATPEGHEIGRAQALQAEAAGVPPSVHMNPILIKPTGDAASQIVVRGQVWGNLDARTYHDHRAMALLPIVEESYRALASQYDVVVIEGAGSPAEINLKENDIVNMRMAKLAHAPCLLVGDIDRGGVFAALLGTCELLDAEERSYIRGFVINKFRGDISLLMPGVRMIEQRLKKSCLGVVPYIKDLTLDEEDSVALGGCEMARWTSSEAASDMLHIGVIALPSISNFTDFASLQAEPSVSLRYLRDPENMSSAGLVILPGSKQTASDLRWLRSRGFEGPLLSQVAKGGLLVGICGGLQMLGEEIVDPHGVESGGRERGLGILRLRTVLTDEKITVPARGRLHSTSLFGIEIGGQSLSGYEIHMGQTEYLRGTVPFAKIRRQTDPQQEAMDGCLSADERVMGTYLHGLFEEDAFRHAFLVAARRALHLPAAEKFFDWRQHRERQLDRLADTFASALDLDTIRGLLRLPAAGVRKEAVR